MKNFLTQEVVIGGWTEGKGERDGSLGALLLGVPSDDGLDYVGKVGTGFTAATRKELLASTEAARAQDDAVLRTAEPRRDRRSRTSFVPSSSARSSSPSGPPTATSVSRRGADCDRTRAPKEVVRES